MTPRALAPTLSTLLVVAVCGVAHATPPAVVLDPKNPNTVLAVRQDPVDPPAPAPAPDTRPKPKPAPPAAPPQLFGDSEVKPFTLATVRVQGAPAKGGVFWEVAGKPALVFDPAGKPAIVNPEPSLAPQEKNAKAVTFTGPPGDYAVTCTVTAAGPDGVPETVKLLKTVTVSGLGPIPPPGPVPPGPNPPGPNPPGPTPPPRPTPPAPAERLIDGPPDGLQVLIVLPSNNPSVVRGDVYAVGWGEEVRGLLDARCVKDPATGEPDRRVWWDNQALVGVAPRWTKAMERYAPKAKTAPYYVISSTQGGSEGPVTTKAAFLAELKKWGGQ